MGFWLIFPPGGGDPHQIRTEDRSAPGERDNPEGWEAVRVSRHSHDPGERFDRGKGRWIRCPERAAAAAARNRAAAEKFVDALPEGVIDIVAERVAATLKGGTTMGRARHGHGGGDA